MFVSSKNVITIAQTDPHDNREPLEYQIHQEPGSSIERGKRGGLNVRNTHGDNPRSSLGQFALGPCWLFDDHRDIDNYCA